MARNSERLNKRNIHVRERFRYHRKRNPKWSIEAVIDAVADEVFLSPGTISKILKKADITVPSHPTIVRRLAQIAAL